MINSETWTWERIGAHQAPAFLGVWQAIAYVAEGPLGWYAAAEGYKTGPDYVYRLPGRTSPSGPHTHPVAVGIARQMIGLAADASTPSPDHLVLYQGSTAPGRAEYEAQDVTGVRWALASSGDAHSCVVCDQQITSGWAEGPWKQARRFICSDHVEVRLEVRPAQQGLPPSSRSMHADRRRAPVLAEAHGVEAESP